MNGEIVVVDDPAFALRLYRDAVDKQAEVEILAQLYGCTAKAMANWLRSQGMTVDNSRPKRRGRFKVRPELEEEAETEENIQPESCHADPAEDPAEEKVRPDTARQEKEGADAVKEAAGYHDPDDTDTNVGKTKPDGRKTNAKRVRVYIGGPITGNPDYLAEFGKTEAWIRSIGLDPVNPATNNADDYRGYINCGMNQLMECDMICLLPGWADSKGASLEKNYAEVVGIPELMIPVKVWDQITAGKEDAGRGQAQTGQE